jgi:protein ImuA
MMSDSIALIARLRRIAAGTGPAHAMTAPVDAWLARGLGRAQLHDIYAIEGEDGPSGAGFGIASTLAAGALPLLWLRTEAGERSQGRLHATGLIELGLSAESLVLGVVADEAALLRAAADAARCAGLGTVLVESVGRAPGFDLTATRRLMLAAESSGVTILSLRIGAQPTPSAAATRWSVAAVPSTALDQGVGEGAPGFPAFDVECLRRRGGPAGQRWRVEWDRDAKSFRGASLSGAGLSVAADRAAARHPAASVRAGG